MLKMLSLEENVSDVAWNDERSEIVSDDGHDDDVKRHEDWWRISIW
jgi:hypothetical protein